MTTSKPTMRCYALQLPTDPYDFRANVSRLCREIEALPPHSIVVTPEVYVTGYPYDRMEEAAGMAKEALAEILPYSAERIVTLTLIVKENDNFYNRTYVLHNGRVVHTQDKIRLFLLGDEDKYFAAGSEEKLEIFEIEGIKLGLMVCFEVRYSEYWLKLRGADIILLPARWGLPRKKHLDILPRALAICNQCYCVVANSADEEMAKSSAVIDPNGKCVKNDDASVIEGTLDFRRIRLIRRYIRMGLFND
ncbi:carbon-nitrogen hydrolase family protein [Hydrogenimonas urashimensis]|uniref:carbon-nitrogen hydrolase family protein n=1 Tax=Hydrogenimonas urashimensis TaxID=2740515 RepID=UPI0019151C4A|nr:carbon-nitrogen hydrolase family protein [Hydrogenimonas urashimensis]